MHVTCFTIEECILESLKCLDRKESIKMKVAVYYSSEDIRLEEMPKPKIGKEEVLVEMKACGICGSDLMKWYLKSRAPLVLGHEPTGRIIEIGEKVRQFSVGDRVFVHHHVACFTCNYCIRGDYTLCDQFHRTNIVPGGLAEFFIVPAQNLRIDTFKIPESLSFEEATMIEPIGCCIRALKKCRKWWNRFKRNDINVVIPSEHVYKDPKRAFLFMKQTKPQDCFLFPGMEYQVSHLRHILP